MEIGLKDFKIYHEVNLQQSRQCEIGRTSE